METITIIGAGPCGCLLAVYLAKRGYKVNLYERRSDIRKASNSNGRSINLAISERGLFALQLGGVLDAVMAESVPIKGRKVHMQEGTEDTRTYIYGRNEREVNYSISRHVLNKVLLDSADSFDNVTLHFDAKVESVDLEASVVHIRDAQGHVKEIQSDRIFGTDGATSAVRTSLGENTHASFDLQTLSHGYKEILLPKDASEGLDLNYLHIWPRKEFMLMGLANLDGSMTMTLFMPLEGEVGLNTLTTKDQVQSFFETYFPDMLTRFPEVVERFLENPVSNLNTVRGGPWYHKDKVLLLGDAAHAIVPFFGQGINCGFEDCRLFDEALGESPISEHTFKEFYETRTKDSDAILTMATENYDEMKHHVGEDDFLFKTHIEKELMKRFPDQYISRYVLVSYTHEPYSFAQHAGKLQKTLVQRIYDQFKDSNEIDWERVTPWVHQYFSDLQSQTQDKKAA